MCIASTNIYARLAVTRDPGRWAMAELVSVNVGEVQRLGFAGRSVRTAIRKSPVDGAVFVGAEGLAGDRRGSPRAHGGPDHAVYAYAAEDLAWWGEQLDRDDLGPGRWFGENLTVSGIGVNAALVGERWAVGEAVLEVAAPRVPCPKLGVNFGDEAMPDRLTEAGRPGAYLRVISEGAVSAGASIDVLHRPDQTVTVAFVLQALQLDHSLAPQLLAAAALPDPTRRWAEQQAAKVVGS